VRLRAPILVFLQAFVIGGLVLPALAANQVRGTPFLAIWMDSAGYRQSEAPYLRIAIWDDGYIIFARDPKKWSHDLLQGQIEPERLAEVKKKIARTSIFKLKSTAHLVPDASVDCLMVELDGKRQVLKWDEVETDGYGANSSPFTSLKYRKFKKCWKEINKLALAAVPKESQPYTNRIERFPESWRAPETMKGE
jgi:hypothetical protein